ncbi:MAG: hypothetical protein AAF628_11405 [Planctomycetota bacterium]
MARFPSSWPVTTLLALLHCGLAAVFLLGRASGTDAAWTGFPLDDAWIHMVYGQSVAEHGLPYYNPGQLESGFTSPLWVIVAAAAHVLASWFGATPWMTLKVFGVLFGAGIVVCVERLVRAWTVGPWPALFAGLLAALCPLGVFGDLSGMEVSLATCLSLAGILAVTHQRLTVAGLLIAGAGLARPECALLAGLAAAVMVNDPAYPRPAMKLQVALRLGAPTAMGFAAWSLYCLYATGRPLPATLYAKFDMPAAPEIPGVIAEAVAALPAASAGAVLALAPLALLRLARPDRRTALTLTLLYPWIFLFAISRSRALPEGYGTFFVWTRYVQPALPFLFVAMAVGLDQLAHLAKRMPVAWLRPAPAAAAAVLALAPYPAAWSEQRARYAWNCQNMNEVQVALGQWVAQETAPGSAVALNDAGAIRYFGERPALDLIGLNCADLLRPEMQHVLFEPRAMANLMRLEGAQHLIIFPRWFPDLVQHREFARVFTPVASFHSDHYTVAHADASQSRMWAFELRTNNPPQAHAAAPR